MNNVTGIIIVLVFSLGPMIIALIIDYIRSLNRGKNDMTQEQVIPARFRYVRTRKKHRCEGCHRVILPNTRVLNVSGRLGRWFNEYWCSSCDLDRIMSIPDKYLREKIRKARFSFNEGKTQ